jgi:RecA-family ATPase
MRRLSIFKVNEFKKIDIETDVISRLRKVKRNGNGWVACCPSHDDKNPSLSIGVGLEGKPLFYCHKGCSFEDILDALGLCSFEDDSRRLEVPSDEEPTCEGIEREQAEREQAEQRRICSTYDYTDETGNLIYQVVRYEPKDFRIRKPKNDGSWEWRLGDSPRVPYRLPDVIAAREEDSYLIFTEGEKDSQNAKEHLGFFSTTIATGANAWKEYLADYFVGSNIVIVPDNDEAGREFAQTVANSIFAKAKAVKVLTLPNLPEKGDISDWIENGGNREELLALIQDTPHWSESRQDNKQGTKTNDFFIAKSCNQWMQEAQNSPIPRMLFGEFWFEGEICMLFADSNVGKSILAVQIADAITKGKEIGSFRREIERQPVLYFDFELSARQFGNRYGQNSEGNLTNLYQFDEMFIRAAINPDGDLSDIEKFEDTLFRKLESLIAEKDVKIIIVDNLTYLKNDNEKAKEALRLMKRLKALKEKYGLSILALAHTPKRSLENEITLNDLSGSKMLINFCDSAFAIGKSYKDESIRYVKQIKERNTGKKYGRENVCIAEISKPINFLSFDFNGFGIESEHLRAQGKTEREVEIQRALDLEAEGFTQRQISAEMGWSVGKTNDLLKKGKKLGLTGSQRSDVQSSDEVGLLNAIDEAALSF